MSGSAAASATRIFVSHSHEDDAFCRRLIGDLRTRLGEDAVWYDASGGLHGGDDWWERIVAEITARPYFLVVLSPHADASGWVRQEMAIAFRQHVEWGKRLLPLRIAPSPRRADWAGIHEFDFQAQTQPERYAAALVELLRVLGVNPDAHISAPSAQPAAAPPQQVSMPGKPEPGPGQIRAPRPRLPGHYSPASVQRAGPAPANPILPRERFPERLERLGFAAEIGRDPQTGKEVAFIRPPLCPVPAGPFLMGSDPRQDSQARENEQPQHEVRLPTYQIGKFPVTVAEYACFVATGHLAPRKGNYGLDWQTQLAHLDHPVTCVTWCDARDYVSWLARLTGQPWKLPSEEEWEKAARWDPKGNGGRGLSCIYPWGNRFDKARCNTSASNIGTTTAVDSYGPENPAHDGSSPCGAQDMAGNIWEWARTAWDEQAYGNKTFHDDDGSSALRVLRGGAWNDSSWSARAADRNAAHQEGWEQARAFRDGLFAAK